MARVPLVGAFIGPLAGVLYLVLFAGWADYNSNYQAGTSSPLEGMGTAASSFSGVALLARASANSLGGTEMPVFVYVFPAQAGRCFCMKWALLPADFLAPPCWSQPLQILWVEPNQLCFP